MLFGGGVVSGKERGGIGGGGEQVWDTGQENGIDCAKYNFSTVQYSNPKEADDFSQCKRRADGC